MSQSTTLLETRNDHMAAMLQSIASGSAHAIAIFADWLEERDDPRGPEVRKLAELPLTEKQIAKAVYESRRDRRSHPEGNTDRRSTSSRWYPSDREDAGDVEGCVRSPSRAWPWSYMLRARTRKHVAVLVERMLAGEDVPEDICESYARARLVLSLFSR